MSILQYFQRKNTSILSLPDPNGPLSNVIPSSGIEMANKMIVTSENTSKKLGQYNTFSPQIRAAIGKYSSLHGSTRAAQYYTKVLKKKVNESTVRTITKKYREEVRGKWERDEDDTVVDLATKKPGRQLLLGEEIDHQVQVFIRKIRDNDGAVSNRLVVAAAKVSSQLPINHCY